MIKLYKFCYIIKKLVLSLSGDGSVSCPQIGSWSRWLTDIFGIDDNDAPEDKSELGDDKKLECQTPFRPFRLLNALSDLMMLPHEMLADRSTRKEVQLLDFNFENNVFYTSI